MVLEELIVGSSPFLVGISVFIGLSALLAYLRATTEITVLVLFPVTFMVVGDMIGGISPIATMIAGVIIGMFFLAIIKR